MIATQNCKSWSHIVEGRCEVNLLIMMEKCLKRDRKVRKDLLVFPNMLDAYCRVPSLDNIENFLRSLMEMGFDLSSPRNIVVCNLFLVIKIGKLDL